MARGLKFRIKVVHGLYYLRNENEGADQVRGDWAADLRLCFCMYAKNRFSNDATQISKVPVNNCSVMSGLELTLPRYGE